MHAQFPPGLQRGILTYLYSLGLLFFAIQQE